MLSLLGIVALVLGGVAAGGGVFDWEFLFSDGYREWVWVRSLGRDGARGVLALLGGVLLMVGFVAQVVDSASKPALAAVAPADEPSDAEDEPPAADGSTADDAGRLATTPENFVQPPLVAGSAVGEADQPPVSSSPGVVNQPARSAPPPGPQPVTIWNPLAERQDTDARVTIQYRFEPGHRPRPGSRYFWIIDMLGVTNEVEYDAQALRQGGQLTHIIRLPPEESDSQWVWATTLMVETNGRRAQVSNRLEITPGEEVGSASPPLR